MATSPNAGNSTPSEFGLPYVAEGDPIKASDINALSSAIEKISIGFGEGYSFSRFGRNGTLTVEDQTSHNRQPWGVVVSGKKLLINVANVFLNGTDKEFRPLSSYGFSDAGTDKGSVLAGNLIKFEVPGADAADSSSINPQSGVLACDFLPGYYYIEVKYDIFSNLIDNILNFKVKGEAFLRYSASQDTIGEQITTPFGTKRNDNVYPICTVTGNAVIIQGVRSDIFARGPDLSGDLPDLPDVDWPKVELPDVFDHPFKIKLEQQTNGSYTIQLVPGTVCNVLPRYEDENGPQLWQTSTWTITPTANMNPVFIYLACRPGSELEANGGRFPRAVVAKRATYYNPESFDKDDEGTLLIGVLTAVKVPYTQTVKVNGVDTEQTFYKWVAQAKQFVSTSVWAERRKYSDLVASYYFFRV